MFSINFDSLPMTPEDARAARNYLGLSQAKAAAESELPAHKIKRFELGNYIPDEAFLKDLRAFFEGRGYEFQDTQKPGENARGTGQVFPAGVVGETKENQGSPGPSRPQRASFHHMRIAVTDEAAMGRMLDMIEGNEEKAHALLAPRVDAGLFGGLAETTEKRHAQVMRLLADNGVMFAKLFGREIGGAPKPEVLAGKKRPETGADLLHSVQADLHLASSGDHDAKERQKARKLAASVLDAIGLS